MVQQTADVPTVTEFIPADQNGVRQEAAGVQHLRPTADGGLEITMAEPANDSIENRVYICDECGHSESQETDIAAHMVWEHGADEKRQLANAQKINADSRIR